MEAAKTPEIKAAINEVDQEYLKNLDTRIEAAEVELRELVKEREELAKKLREAKRD